MYYDFNRIQGKVIDYLKKNKIELSKSKELSVLFSYLNTKSLTNNGVIKYVYFQDNSSPYFLDIEQVNKIEEEIFKLINIKLPLKTISKGNDIFPNNSYIKINVDNFETYQKMEEFFIDNSLYGVSFKKRQQERADKKADKKIEKEKEIAKAKSIKDEIFNKKTSLDMSLEKLNIVSIDLEFFLNKKNKTHKISEVGVSIINNGSKINEHFLIDGQYQKKENKIRQQNFKFGKSKVIEEKDIKTYLDVVLKHSDIVLFHEEREDVEALKQVGVNLEEHKHLRLMDTQLIYLRYFRKRMLTEQELLLSKDKRKEELQELLNKFNVDYNKKDFHNAGNDAEYTLRLLFSMKKFFDNKNEASNKNEDEKIKEYISFIASKAKERGVSVIDLVKMYSEEEKKTKKFKLN